MYNNHDSEVNHDRETIQSLKTNILSAYGPYLAKWTVYSLPQAPFPVTNIQITQTDKLQFITTNDKLSFRIKSLMRYVKWVEPK